MAEAAVVGKKDEITGQAIFAFVILKADQQPSDALAVELREHVATVIGPIARPKFLLFVPDLPKTRSGKIMRRLLRDIAEGRALGDTTTLADAASSRPSARTPARRRNDVPFDFLKRQEAPGGGRRPRRRRRAGATGDPVRRPDRGVAPGRPDA